MERVPAARHAAGRSASLFAAISLLVSGCSPPAAPTAAKTAPYECGIVPSRDPPERFPVRFYLVAMIFIIFDIEIIFLYPWAVVYRELGAFGLWRDGAVRRRRVRVVRLPRSATAPSTGARSSGGPVVDRRWSAPHRTSQTTIRRVGLEGRAEPLDAASTPRRHA